MKYIIRSLQGQHALFCYNGSGRKQVSSYLYKDGKIALFEFEHHAIKLGDELALENPDIGEYNFEPAFMKTLK